MVERKVADAIRGMHEEVQAQIIQVQAGRPGSGSQSQFQVFCGPGELLASLRLPTRHVGDILAITAAQRGGRAYMGPQLFPMYEDLCFPFMARRIVETDWQAQLEATKVLYAFIELDATAVRAEAWGLPCTQQYLYLGPVRTSWSRFTVLVFELDKLDLERPGLSSGTLEGPP